MNLTRFYTKSYVHWYICRILHKILFLKKGKLMYLFSKSTKNTSPLPKLSKIMSTSLINTRILKTTLCFNKKQSKHEMLNKISSTITSHKNYLHHFLPFICFRIMLRTFMVLPRFASFFLSNHWFLEMLP